MKKYIILLIFMMSVVMPTYSQALHVFHDHEEKADVYLNAAIDSIRIKKIIPSIDDYEYVIYATTGVVKYHTATIDSIKFNLPHMKFFPINGNLKIPSEDYLYVDPRVYFSGLEENPVLIRPNGETLNIAGGYGIEGCAMGVYSVNMDTSGIKDNSKETWYITSGQYRDSISVEYTGLPLFSNKWHDIWVSSEKCEYKLENPTIPDIKLDLPDWVTHRYDSEGNIILEFSQNDSMNPKGFRLNPHTDFVSGFSKGSFSQVKKFVHTQEENMKALKDFYESTNMKELGVDLFSDKPLWEWCMINHIGDRIWLINDHIVSFNPMEILWNGGCLTGTIPSTFNVFMDEIYDNGGEFDLSHHALYGVIPESVTNNTHWQKYGWNVIPQSIWLGGGFEMNNINLHLDNAVVEDFVTDTTTTVYDVLSKNKLTWVFNGGTYEMIEGISDERVNKYLDYKDLGFGLVVSVFGYSDLPWEDYRNYVLNERKNNGLPEGILWTRGFDKADVGSIGSMSLIDDKGALIWYKNYDSGLPDSYYLSEIDEICQKYFGKPIEHPEYISTQYESTDFSRDGEILTLQTATVGNGIDLVFTGDMFVDKDLEAGGAFEEEVTKAMEYFFSVEPYLSLRNRFNVYAVKAVSINNYRGTNHAFNYNDEKVLEYAYKIPGIDKDNVTIAVLHYNPNISFFASGYTVMLDNGASIAYIEEGGADRIIVHEAGGHGFAKLLDEYIASGYEDSFVPDDQIDDFKRFIKTSYHDRGWGMNVSTTDNPEEVPWSRFLKDKRYAGETGIYKGAWYYPQNLWRPSENSVMNTDYSIFNVPSREAIYKRIMQLSEGETWNYDYETFVEFDTRVMKQERQKSTSIHKAQKPIVHKAPVLKKLNGKKIENVAVPFKRVEEQGSDKMTCPTSRSGASVGSKIMRQMEPSGKKGDKMIIHQGQIYYYPCSE